MSVDLPEALASLTRILAEENALLRTPGYHAALGDLVAAKQRLAGLIGAELVRSGERWPEACGPDACDAVRPLLVEVQDLLRDNAALLRRRIALCDDLLGAIADDARRRTGGRASTYGARGRIAHVDQAVPIAINASL